MVTTAWAVNSQSTAFGPAVGGTTRLRPLYVFPAAVTDCVLWARNHRTGKCQSIALRYRDDGASARVVNVCASKKSAVLITSLPLCVPFGWIPGEGGVPTGTVPALNLPAVLSNMAIT